jgi:hypothetical protein
MEWSERINTWLSENLDDFHHCYYGIRTGVQVHFIVEIGANGTDAWIAESSTTDCKVTRCLKDALRSAKLPPRPASVPASKSVAISDVLSFRPFGTPRVTRGGYALEELLSDGPCIDQTPARWLDTSREPDAVDVALLGAKAKLRACYDEGLSRNSQLTGKVTAEFSLASDGSVSAVGIVENTLPDCEAVACLSDVIRRLKFDKQIAPATLRRSFSYYPWK